ncbi:MAG: BamA/TamA family outer membrane protein [Proteobacteria bacterium]|nr:BamA/TamA family outer membrane protein [Pseudomonadota bacterium]
MGRLRQGLVVCALAGVLLAGATVRPAQAFFGLFGESLPDPTATTLPYSLTIDGVDRGIRQRLEDASVLYRLRQDPPPDAETLLARAARDITQIRNALFAEGYYNANVTMTVAGQPLAPFEGLPPAGANRAAAALQGRERVPITVTVDPGRRFTLRSLRVEDNAGRVLTDIPERRLGIGPGDPASAPDLRGARARIIDYYRSQSRPLTQGGEIEATVDHRSATMDAVIRVEPGAVAAIGPIGISGTKGVPEAVVRSFIYASPGDAYSPSVMADIRKSVLRVPALGSASVREAGKLDAAGQLPITIEVTERPLRLIGASARMSSLDGPALRAYWEHRNLLGGAEHLRIEGETFTPPRTDNSKRSIKDFGIADVGGRLRLAFMKPALYGSRNDLIIGALAERDRTGGDRYGGYTVEMAEIGAGIRHRFSDRFFVQGGLKYEIGRTTDALGTVHYNAIGVPLSVSYDSTDNLLDPTMGMRFIAQTTPYFSLGKTDSFVESKAQVSAYHAFDEDARYILAGRMALGSVAGAATTDVPANHRFYAGGSGSVRGYRNRSLGPLAPNGLLIGGRSLFEASVEMRVKVTETIGIVPFLDAGGAFSSQVPDFDEQVHYAAGLGLRYYTGIGPIRLDVATPLNRRKGDRPVALYISIGQAF